MNVSHNTIHELEILRHEAECNAQVAAALAEKFHKAIVDAIAGLKDPNVMKNPDGSPMLFRHIGEHREAVIAILEKALSP